MHCLSSVAMGPAKPRKYQEKPRKVLKNQENSGPSQGKYFPVTFAESLNPSMAGRVIFACEANRKISCVLKHFFTYFVCSQAQHGPVRDVAGQPAQAVSISL